MPRGTEPLWDAEGVSSLPLAVTIPASVVVTLMVVAVLIAIAGHLSGVRQLVASGLLLLFVATFGMILGGFGAWRDTPGPIPDQMRDSNLQVPENESIGEARENYRQSQR